MHCDVREHFSILAQLYDIVSGPAAPSYSASVPYTEIKTESVYAWFVVGVIDRENARIAIV